MVKDEQTMAIEKEKKKTEEKTENAREDTHRIKEEKKEKPREESKEKIEEKPREDKKEAVKPPKEKPKKIESVVNARNLPISTKQSAAICKFIKNKKIEDAISDLEQVLKLKKPVPMKGEIPHKKGKSIMSGRFPKKAASRFIILLKSLAANSSNDGLENPIIIEAIANIGSRPYGRFGQVRKKRTQIKILAKERKEKGEKIK